MLSPVQVKTKLVSLYDVGTNKGLHHSDDGNWLPKTRNLQQIMELPFYVGIFKT